MEFSFGAISHMCFIPSDFDTPTKVNCMMCWNTFVAFVCNISCSSGFQQKLHVGVGQHKGTVFRLRLSSVQGLMPCCACFLFLTDYRCCFCCQTNPGGRESDYPRNMGELTMNVCAIEHRSESLISSHITSAPAIHICTPFKSSKQLNQPTAECRMVYLEETLLLQETKLYPKINIQQYNEGYIRPKMKDLYRRQ